METKKLIIRETKFEDCKLFADWENREEVSACFAVDDGRDYEEIVREFIDRGHDNTKMQLTITLKPSGEPIGRIIVDKIDDKTDSMDIKWIYIADQKHRNQGYAQEALARLLEHAFINMHMERVTIDHLKINKIASHTYKKLGFQDEGVMRNAGKKNGKYLDLHLKSILRSDFLNGKHHGNLD